MTLLKINRLLPIYISIVPPKFKVDIQSQSNVRVRKPKKSNMAARWPFWKWHRWKSIGFCLWPPSTCKWNLKLKFQSKLDLCSGNHVVYRQTGGRTDRRTTWIHYTPPPTSLGEGIITENNIRLGQVNQMLGSTPLLCPGLNKPGRDSLSHSMEG